MPHDPLATAMRLRQQALDEARRTLNAAVTAAGDAAALAQAAERTIAGETALAVDPDGDDAIVEAFAAWLPGARQRLADARIRQDHAEAEVARCRAALAACRIGLETITQLHQSRRATAQAVRTREEIRALDEAAARRRPPP